MAGCAKNDMYEKVIYHLDDQGYLYDRFINSPAGESFYNFRFACFVICFLLLAVSLVFAVVYRPGTASIEAVRPHTEKAARLPWIVIVLPIVFLTFLFLLRNHVAFAYMDFSYFYEGSFSGFREFLIKKQYLSNIHAPGYLLISWCIRSFLGGAREAYLIVNFLALAAAIVPAYKLLARNLSRESAIFATLSFYLSPIIVYTFFRISPYAIIAFLFIYLAYFYIVFIETGRKSAVFGMLATAFILPFMHVLTFAGIFIFLIAFFTSFMKTHAAKQRNAGYFVAVVTAALGSILFNTGHIFVFKRALVSISAPATERLNVYFQTAAGNLDFIPLCTTFILNIYSSFLTLNPLPAIITGSLFVAGAIALVRHGKNGLLFSLLGIASGGVLIATDALNHVDFNGYPMSYRHLAMMSFFFLYVVFFAAERFGKLFSRNNNISASMPCLLILILFIFNLPGVLKSMQSPDMFSALRYVYDRAEYYDGVITGNIFFMNEYRNYFFSEMNERYSIRPVFQTGETLQDEIFLSFARWCELNKPGADNTVQVMTDIAPMNIDSFHTLLQNNFIQRTWFLDNDDRFLGVFPDFSGRYENELKSALSKFRLIEKTSGFSGVDIELYAIEHQPIITSSIDSYTITAGVNDFYFVRGVSPDTLLYSDFRNITEQTQLLVFIQRGVDLIKVRFDLKSAAPSSLFALKDIQSQKTYYPVNSDGNALAPEYLIERTPGDGHLIIGFRDFGVAAFSSITISSAEN